jgi:hypothetical protein
MALDKNARNKLLKLVQASKRVLFKEIIEQLQQHFGIYPDSGKILMLEQLTTSESDTLYKAKLLRERLLYIKINLADTKNQDVESINQLIREQAFTILNRMAALRMAEERNFIRETIREAYNSEGFQVFDSITGQGQTVEIFIRYKWYLNAVFDELALDLPAIFDRFSPYGIITPGEKTLLELIDLINREEISIHREEGKPPTNLWKEDETIGWIYQYYNSREEISAMRDASDAPRNSRELAVRNQFFTPRYIVQFLTDNSLGRIWFEMTKGKTSLKEYCPYLIVRQGEVFLEKGQTKPTLSDKELFYIDYRPIKDPRDIKMLDPACGSMHFGLYSFDLFEIIYIEAWDNHPDLLLDLKNSMTRKDFIKQIPVLIIRHNIHGVDIDPRALQIAALSLWLRAQKSFDKLDLNPIERPQITKSNLVLAEPMPGNTELLNEVVKPLDKPMRELVLHIWDLMKMAGETGLLLRIEKEIDDKIKLIVKGLKDEAKNTQISIGANEEQLVAAEEAAKYVTKAYRSEFLTKAEDEVLRILKTLAEEAHNGDAYQKLLFADDSARGFAFIELCRQEFDVVLMNPPFGMASINTEKYINSNYPNWGRNILAAFFSRMMEMNDDYGLLGAIYDRTVAIKSSYEAFRKECLCGHITAMADTGWNVLEANVETTTTVTKKVKDNKSGFFINVIEKENKEINLQLSVNDINKNLKNDEIYFKSSLSFESLPNSVIGYFWFDFIVNQFNKNKNLISNKLQARDGHNLVSFDHFRLFWEISNVNIFETMYNGGEYSLFYQKYRDCTIYGKEGYLVKSHKSTNFRNLDFQKQIGIGYGKRGEIFDAHILKKSFIFTKEGQAISNIKKEDAIKINGFLNSSLSQYNLSLFAGQHKASGYVNLLPLPDKYFNEKLIFLLLEIKRKWFSLDETVLEFHHLLHLFSKQESLKSTFAQIQTELRNDKNEYLKLVDENDEFWLNAAEIPKESRFVFHEFKKKRPKENLISIDGITDETIENNPVMAYEIISNLLGIAFGRWDIRSIINPTLIPEFGDFFDALPFMPVVSLSDIPTDYSIVFPENGILVQDEKHESSIKKAIERVINVIWGKAGNKIINELAEIGNFTDLQSFFEKPAGFFDFHYTRYSKSRRDAPIYWPISTPSGSFALWIYYPLLDKNTLYSVVNNFLTPKIEEVEDDIRKLQNNQNLENKGKVELNDKQNFLHELHEFEHEILRVAKLPYEPAHDDGVLITAAPLYSLFRHSKWRKSTEDCWKRLEKGEYDWAHLAYNIWPERVRKKCIKDLSMAISHGLENICEVKPKEKKTEKVKELKEIKKSNEINFIK